MLRLLEKVKNVTRWKDWSTGSVTMLFALGALVALSQRARFELFAGDMMLFMLFAMTHSALGYAVNSWGDRALDAAQGRANPFNGMSAGHGRAWLLGAALIGLLTALPFLHRASFSLVWGGWIFTMLAYSLPPLRLKAHGGWGLFVDCAAQYALPTVLLFLGLGGLSLAWNLMLVIAMTLTCLSLELGHQRVDRAADSISGAATFAVRQPETRLDAIYGAALLLDTAALAMFTGCAVWALVSAGHFWVGALGVALGLGVLALIFVALPQEIKAVRAGQPIDPHYGATIYLPSKLLHESVGNTLLPAVLGLALTFLDARYTLLLAAFLIWRLVLYRPNWRLLLVLFGRQNA